MERSLPINIMAGGALLRATAGPGVCKNDESNAGPTFRSGVASISALLTFGMAMVLIL